MNEIKGGGASVKLSEDLNIITAEINAYQRVAGEAIFEIGRRLKHVKENDLAHGEFGKWLDRIEINRRVAQQMIKVASDSDLKTRTSSHLGLQALYEIATLPPDQREQPHTVPSTGETKTIDEMTVRELREVKKALKEAENARDKAVNEADMLRDTLESMDAVKAEVRTEYPDVFA